MVSASPGAAVRCVGYHCCLRLDFWMLLTPSFHTVITGRKITSEFDVRGSDSFGENIIHLVKAFNPSVLLSDVTSRVQQMRLKRHQFVVLCS